MTSYKIPPSDLSIPSETDAREAVATLLRYLEEDISRDGLKETPDRVLRSLREMTSGYRQSPEVILSRVFEGDGYDEIVILRDIPFTSLCEHHLLAFSGVVDVGYLPSDKVVGLSRLARLVDCFSHRLQVQERLTKQIADAIREHLSTKGVAVVVRAEHSCMSCRGVRKPGSQMITSVMTGVFRDIPAARQEFLALVGKRP